jgi:serine protease Do
MRQAITRMGRWRTPLGRTAGVSLLIAALAAFGGMSHAHAAQAAETHSAQVAARVAPVKSGSLEDTQAAIANVATRVSPSVVTITTTRTQAAGAQGGQEDLFNNPFFRQFFGNPGRMPTPSQPDMEMGMGSGVIVSPNGYILTNNHIVEDASQLQVELSNGQRYSAQVVGRDPPSDLALLHIDASGLPAIRFGDSSRLRVGDIVLAVGNPFGVGETVTMGIVSAMGRNNVGITEYDDFIQTDASINPGNSGGALVNLQGELIGINTAILSRTGGSQGVGFAIPSTLARTVMTGLREHGRVVRGWLGVGIQDLTPELARGLSLNETTHGALVSEVEPNTPAAEAGLQPGDVIVSLDGSEMHDAGQLRTAVAALGTGSTARLGVLRDGRPITLTAQIGERPEQQVSSGERELPQQPNEVTGSSKLSGVTVAPATSEQLERAGASPQDSGMIVTSVAPSSLAAMAGLRPGDVIIEVNSSRVGSTQDFLKSSRDAQGEVMVRVLRGGHPLYLAWR